MQRFVLTLWLLALGLFAPFAQAVGYRVSVDTRAVGGQSGALYLSLGGLEDSPPAGAVVSGFGGAALGGVVASGAAGTLSSALRLDNAAGYAEHWQRVEFGGQFGFTLEFDGDWRQAGAGSGTTFALKLLGADDLPLLTTDAEAGDLLRVELLPGLEPEFALFPATAGGTSVVSISAVPEPETLAMMAVGALGVGLRLRRRLG